MCICVLGLIARNGVVAGRRKGSGKKNTEEGKRRKGIRSDPENRRIEEPRLVKKPGLV